MIVEVREKEISWDYHWETELGVMMGNLLGYELVKSWDQMRELALDIPLEPFNNQ